MHAAHKSSVQSTPASRSVAMPGHRPHPSYALPMNVLYIIQCLQSIAPSKLFIFNKFQLTMNLYVLQTLSSNFLSNCGLFLPLHYESSIEQNYTLHGGKSVLLFAGNCRPSLYTNTCMMSSKLNMQNMYIYICPQKYQHVILIKQEHFTLDLYMS